MILKTLRIKDFRSYESAAINFSPGQNYFFGRNWQGKSSIMDAIGFAIFGRSVFPLKLAGSSVKVDNLVREGATSGFVDLIFEHRDAEFTIHRKCPGNSVELSTEGKILGHSVTTVREALYDLLGIDEKLFVNVFYSEQDELRKTLESKPEERKMFIEMLLGFDYLKNIQLNAKHAFDSLTVFMDEVTSGNMKTVIDLIGDIETQVDHKQTFVTNLEKEFEKESKSAINVSVALKKMGDSQRKAEKLLQEKSEVESESKLNGELLDGIGSGRCPACKQVIPDDLKLRLIHELKEKISALQKRISSLERNRSKANSDWGLASREYEDGLTRSVKISDLRSTLRPNKRELDQLRATLEKYEKQYKAFSNKNRVIHLINKEKSFLNDFQSSIQAFRDSLRVNVVKDLENGVNHFMSQFSDNDFDAKLQINEDFGIEVTLHNNISPIFNLSGAAKDILALAFRYGLYRIAARDVNFILFDEPTRHMDQTNTLKLKQSFNEMRDQQVVVITVHDEFYDANGTKFMIEKDEKLNSVIHKI